MDPYDVFFKNQEVPVMRDMLSVLLCVEDEAYLRRGRGRCRDLEGIPMRRLSMGLCVRDALPV